MSDVHPDWSPDSTKLTFYAGDSGHDIYVMNADGSGRTNLTNSGASDFGPAWSPDGTKIAFNSDMDGNQEIYVMNAVGSGPMRLTNNPASDTFPDWQPFIYDFSGFFSPVDNPPVFNTAKAGSSIPVKFSLSGDQGLDIFDQAFPPRSGSSATGRRRRTPSRRLPPQETAACPTTPAPTSTPMSGRRIGPGPTPAAS